MHFLTLPSASTKIKYKNDIPKKICFFKNRRTLQGIENLTRKTTNNQDKERIKRYLFFSYYSIDYKEIETNKHFYISFVIVKKLLFVNIASEKIYKNIDLLQVKGNRNRNNKEKTKKKTKIKYFL